MNVLNDIEKRLAEEKARYDKITAPDEMEARLRNALSEKTIPTRKRVTPIWKLAAVAIIFMIFVGYNYNAFAFYGKKLLGFDEVISGTLKDLNEEGMGQLVDKSTKLPDGTILTIDGVMTDENQLIMYYTLTNQNGFDDPSAIHNIHLSEITGFLTRSSMNSGMSLIDETGTEVKGTYSFDPVSPFSKKLTLHFRAPNLEGSMKQGEIRFPYNPNKAMQTQMKQSIKKTVDVDKGTIQFISILATPTSTVINGRLNVDNFGRLPFAFSGINLIANGEEVNQLGSGFRSLLRGGYNFELKFDALPSELTTLDLVVEQFIGYEEIDAEISLKTLQEEPYVIGGKELWIHEIATTSRGTEVTFVTDQDVLLDGLSIETSKERTPLSTTTNHREIKLDEGRFGDARFLNERTMIFETELVPETLIIEGIHYMKQYGKKIEIIK